MSENPVIQTIEKKEETQRLVLLALLPSVLAGLIHFGTEALIVLLLSIGIGIVCDIIYDILRKKEEKKLHYGTILICLVYALILPPGLPWYCVIAGSAFALVIGKYAFTSDRTYFLNPALIAKAFLLLSFAGPMGKFFYQGEIVKTPLENLMAGEGVNNMKLLLGNTAGSIGTTSILAILLGAIFLLWFDIIHLEIPLGIIVGFFIIAFFSGTTVEGMNRFHYLIAECCSGGLFFGAFFMATEPETSPKSRMEQLIYGLFIGITAACLRFYGNSKEGITYAILAGNLLLPISCRVNSIREARRQRKEAEDSGNS